MKRLFLFITAIVILSAFIGFHFMQKVNSPAYQEPSITIRNHTFTIEIADTNEAQAKGLSYRTSLNQDTGMLFVFEKPSLYTFWMKDMHFPLDILFIKDNIIVTIHENVPNPPSNTPLNQLPAYAPKQPANYVLEINAGLSQKYGFREGDEVIYANFRN